MTLLCRRYLAAASQEGLPWFVTRRRQENMRALFGIIDADGQGTLDHDEANAFLAHM